MSIIGQLKEKVTQYADVYLKLLKINFISRTAHLLSYFIFTVIAIFIVFCMLLFTGFGLVEVFIDLGVTKLGSFFITIGIYFILLLIFTALRRPITRAFASAAIKVLTEDDEPDDKDNE